MEPGWTGEGWPRALYPGVRLPAAQVDTHPGQGADGTVQIHVTRYVPEEPWYAEPETLDTHLMVLDQHLWEAITRSAPTAKYAVEEASLRAVDATRHEALLRLATVVVTAALGEPPMLVLDQAMHRYPWAKAVGVVGVRDVLVGLRTSSCWIPPGTDPMKAHTGYAVTMSAADDGPAPRMLYASALWGWAKWWVDNASALSDRDRSLDELPPPPTALDVVEAWRPHRVVLSQPELTSWPSPPQRPRGPWEDQGLE